MKSQSRKSSMHSLLSSVCQSCCNTTDKSVSSLSEELAQWSMCNLQTLKNRQVFRCSSGDAKMQVLKRPAYGLIRK